MRDNEVDDWVQVWIRKDAGKCSAEKVTELVTVTNCQILLCLIYTVALLYRVLKV